MNGQKRVEMDEVTVEVELEVEAVAVDGDCKKCDGLTILSFDSHHNVVGYTDDLLNLNGGPKLDSVKPDTKIALCGVDTEEIEKCFIYEGSLPRAVDVVEVIPGAYYIDGVLSGKECDQLCAFIDSSSSLSFWSEAGRHNTEARAFRDADTIEFQSKEIAEIMWRRINSALSSSKFPAFNISFAEEEAVDSVPDPRWQVDLMGAWSATGLNDDMLFAKYPSHGSFAPHTDGTAIADFNTRSFFSVVVNNVLVFL
jgi:hypothetical protein